MGGSKYPDRKGRCPGCDLVHSWTGDPKLEDALCTRCARPLEKTSPKTTGTRINARPATKAPA